MNIYPMNYRHTYKNKHREASLNHYYSVEFLINGAKILYQFKLWNSASQSLFIIVKENSEILQQLKEGSIFKAKYYSTDSLCPTVDSKTQIKKVSKDNKGRFKGHYLVGLDILSR